MITRLPLRAAYSGLSRTANRQAPTCLNLIRTRNYLQPNLHPTTKFYSTTPPTPISEPPRPVDLRSQLTSPPQEPLWIPAPPPKPKRSLKPYIYATLFLLLGLTTGQYMSLVIAPPPLPAAGTHEDELMVAFLHKEGEKLPIVQSLTTDPNWESHDAYSTLAPAERSARLTTGALGGARAIGGFQRIFTNKETGEAVTVVWFGGAVAGWPGVTHGGLVATIMDEQLGRCAIRQFPSQTGVTANLEINYLKPIVTNSYYVIRTFPQKEGMTDRKAWVSGRLETLEGRVCVESKGLFVVPKKFKTRTIEAKF